MDRADLYRVMAKRKSSPKDFGTYVGDNGRVNRCVQLMKSGKIKTGGFLLDVGGGIGDLAYAVTKQEKLFDDVYVLDISEQNLKAGKSKGIPGILADVDKEGIYLVDGRCDVVTALDFIEHIVDPEYFARECFRVLKLGGEVFVNTPNIQFWRHQEHLATTGKFPHTSGDRDVFHGGHLGFYTFADLCEIFDSAGFPPEGMRQFHDDEGYVAPPNLWSSLVRPQPSNQSQYVELCERLGNPNLLFHCQKPFFDEDPRR